MNLKSALIDKKQTGHGQDGLYSTVVIKDEQRFWKRILIVDDDEDLTMTFRAVIEDSNNDVNKRIEVYTSNNPVIAPPGFFKNGFFVTAITCMPKELVRSTGF